MVITRQMVVVMLWWYELNMVSPGGPFDASHEEKHLFNQCLMSGSYVGMIYCDIYIVDKFW